MDKIEFRLLSHGFPTQYIPCRVIEIFINDNSLKNIVPSFDRHAFLTPKELYDELTIWYKDIDLNRTAIIAGCVCGVPDCDPIYVTIDESESCIIWHNLRDAHRSFSNSEIRDYVFDKSQYYREIEKLRLWITADYSLRAKGGFKFNSIQNGFLYIDFYKGNEEITVTFDECLSDPIAALVRMYVKLKINEAYSYVSEHLHDCTEVKIDTKIIGAEDVHLKIVVNDFCEAQTVFVIDETFDRGYIFKMFEKLFRDIVLNIDYPYQYPCFSNLVTAEANYCYEIFSKHIEDYPEDNNDEYSNKLVRENVSLTEDGKCLEKIYTRMLKEYIIPNGWLS